MRKGAAPTLAIAALALLTACSNPQPPAGRWVGVYEDQALIVAVRLEISRNGDVRVSAPNANINKEKLTDSDRSELRADLIEKLAMSWDSVAPLALDFDGKIFRKPGGVAPQLEWDPSTRHMTMVYYSGRNASVRVPLTAVADFISPS